MWSTNKKDRCFRSGLLIINCIVCVAIVYIYLTYAGEQEKTNIAISSEDFIQPEKLTSERCTPVCVSRACIWHANMFLKNVNSTADPCDNFSSFLCSGFQREYGPEEKGNVFSYTRKPLKTVLKGILENLQAEPGSASAKMKIAYDSCLNYGSSELLGITELKNFWNKLGVLDWPHLPQDFNFGDVSLPIIFANFVAYAAEDYISLRKVPGNETEVDSLKISFKSYVFNRTTKVPRELAVSMLQYFDLETEQIDTIIKDHEFVKNSVMNFYENFTRCIEAKCPVVHIDCARQNDEDWHDICETVKFVVNFMNINDIVNTNRLIVEEPTDILKKFFPLLQSFPNRSLANFFILNFLKKYQAELNFYFRLSKLKHKDFPYEIMAEYYELDRWKFCVQWIVDNMQLALKNEFFHQYLTKNVTEELINISSDYSSEVADLVSLQEWIPTELKSELVGMLKNLTYSIDLLSKILPNDTYVNKVYQKFLPTRRNFFNNVLQLKRFQFKFQENVRSFNKEESAVYDTDFEVNAYAGDGLDFQLGMFIPPFYIPGHLNLVNRVLLAPMTAHEFGHFILQELGGVVGEEKFEEKRKCVGDQLSRFKFAYLNENLNGSQYQFESIPDNVATTVIDNAIEKYSTAEDVKLPGLPYTTKQLLYMTGSQIWCSKSSLKKDIHHKNIDPHAPDQFRLVAIMQNSRGHHEAFQCPDGSFMNPAAKCSLLDTNS